MTLERHPLLKLSSVSEASRMTNKIPFTSIIGVVTEVSEGEILKSGKAICIVLWVRGKICVLVIRVN